jgi:hypothetical protein
VDGRITSRCSRSREDALQLNGGVRARGSIVQFHAASVSVSADGDYFQLFLGPAESEKEVANPHEVIGPYLIVQRDFEGPDDGLCYIEAHDESYIGHSRVQLTELNRTHLVFEIVRKTNNHVDVSFALGTSEFVRVQQIAEIIFGLREPDLDDEAL